MTCDHASSLPSPAPEQRRAAAGLFERAGQVVAGGDHAHAVRLLRECCTLDPANLLYRQALRRAARARYRNNGSGGWFAWLLNWPAKWRLSRALAAGRHADALGLAEAVLARNPWDVPAQAGLARAAEALGLHELAIWSLEQARPSAAGDPETDRALARLYERRGSFHQAAVLWRRIAESRPADAEAGARLAQLAGHAPPASAPEMPSSPVDPVEREAAPLRAAIDADPTLAEAHLALARHYRAAGRLEQAHAALATGLGPTGHAFPLADEMADLAIEPFRRDLAITRDKLAARPDDPALLEIRAGLEMEVLRRELDLARLRADRFPAQARHRFDMGTRLLALGQVEEAMAAFQASGRDEDFRWRSLAGLGHCWRAWSNPGRALRHFEEALTCVPAQEPARLDLLYEAACAHADTGSPDRAVERGSELAEQAPGHRDILHLLPGWQARAVS